MTDLLEPEHADRDVDVRLRASATRYTAGTVDATGDLGEVVRRSRQRARRRRSATSLAMVLVLVAAIALPLRARQRADLDLASEGGAVAVPSSTASGAPTSTSSVPTPVSTVAGEPGPGEAECSIAALEAILQSLGRASAIDRFACFDTYAATSAARSDGTMEASVLRAASGRWFLVSANPASDNNALRLVGVPVDALFRMMGLAPPITPRPVDPRPQPRVSLVEPDPETLPPPTMVGAVVRRFVTDLGPDDLRRQAGSTIEVFDAFVLSTATFRHLRDEEREAISAALTDNGFEVVFVDPVAQAPSGQTTLLIGDPAINRIAAWQNPVLEPGWYTAYVELACGRICSFGADYVAIPDEEGNWTAEPFSLHLPAGAAPEPPTEPVPDEPTPTTTTADTPASTTTAP